MQNAPNPTTNLRAWDAAAYLGIARSTLAKMRMRGDGPRYSKLGRTVVYALGDLDAYLAERQRRSTSESPDAAAGGGAE